MALRELRGITRSATVTAAAALALAAPSAAAYATTGADGATSTSVGTGAGSHRSQPVHDTTTLLPPAPAESASTSWDVLPVATGAAGGVLLVVITFAGITVVRRRRYEHADIANPA
jgi:hypothetical protein